MTGTDADKSGVRYYCYRCGNSWHSLVRPSFCPRCKTSKWDVPVTKHTRCALCGHEWMLSSIDEPCPVCGHNRTDTEDPSILHCNQCDHQWRRRGDSDPKRCPRCRSTRWNEEHMHQFTCRRCGYVWRNRADKPRKCPNCQSTLWNESVYRLQCRRCGYKWSTRGGRTSDDVKMCPRCKSRKWNEVPNINICPSCGRPFISTSVSEMQRCPACSKRIDAVEDRCSFCGSEFTSASGWSVCPVCGKARGSGDRAFDIWSDGERSIRYVYTDDMAFIYLWVKDVPIATVYFKDLLNRLGMTASQMMGCISDPENGSIWGSLASQMYLHRDDWRDDVSYLSKRLNLCMQDAEILAIHFTGMGPEAIALHFGMKLDLVRKSFDRIMAAFVDCGIVVDDSIFTDDAMSMY